MPFARGFKRPTAQAARAAVDTPRIPAPAAIAALTQSAACPPPVPTPTSQDDWLAQYVEPGQTMAEFLGQCPWLSRRKRKYHKGEFVSQGDTVLASYPGATICLLPLGDIGAAGGPSMEALREYTEAFYRGATVRVLPAVDVVVPPRAGAPVLWRSGGAAEPDAELPHRRHGKRIQLQIDGVLAQLRSVQVQGALMVVAVTMYELFDAPSDLFVAGMAHGRHNVAVFSFTRYHPRMTFSTEFWHKISLPPAPPKVKERTSKRKRGKGTAAAAAPVNLDAASGSDRVLLSRCCKLLVHEVGHLLGLDHCIHYSCCMNGSGHLDEDFAQPSFLCPVCLHKAHALFGFDVEARYTGLIDFFEREGLAEDEAGARRLQAAVSGRGAAGEGGGGGAAAAAMGKRARSRGRPAAGPDTVDLTLELDLGGGGATGGGDGAAEVICLHSPMPSMRSQRASGGIESEDTDALPLAQRLAARMQDRNQ